MRRPLARSATRRPMRPRPTTPRVLPVTSMPPNLERSQAPSTRRACACATLRACARISAIVCSAADSELDSGALQTTIPRRVAAATSTLSTPVPARPIDLEARAPLDQVGSDLGRAAHDDPVIVADLLGKLLFGPCRPVVDRHALAQILDTRVRELLADEHAEVCPGQLPGLCVGSHGGYFAP